MTLSCHLTHPRKRRELARNAFGSLIQASEFPRRVTSLLLFGSKGRRTGSDPSKVNDACSHRTETEVSLRAVSERLRSAVGAFVKAGWRSFMIPKEDCSVKQGQCSFPQALNRDERPLHNSVEVPAS